MKTWRLHLERNEMPNTATRWSFLGEVYYNKNKNLLCGFLANDQNLIKSQI